MYRMYSVLVALLALNIAVVYAEDEEEKKSPPEVIVCPPPATEEGNVCDCCKDDGEKNQGT